MLVIHSFFPILLLDGGILTWDPSISFPFLRVSFRIPLLNEMFPRSAYIKGLRFTSPTSFLLLEIIILYSFFLSKIDLFCDPIHPSLIRATPSLVSTPLSLFSTVPPVLFMFWGVSPLLLGYFLKACLAKWSYIATHPASFAQGSNSSCSRSLTDLDTQTTATSCFLSPVVMAQLPSVSPPASISLDGVDRSWISLVSPSLHTCWSYSSALDFITPAYSELQFPQRSLLLGTAYLLLASFKHQFCIVVTSQLLSLKTWSCP